MNADVVDAVQDVLIGLSTGFVSGMLSGYLVYVATKRREKKYDTYRYCSNFLWSALKKCKIYMPNEPLHYFSEVSNDEKSRWQITTRKILDGLSPYELNDRDFSEEEAEFAKNILVAIEELENWKKKNHLR